MSESKASPRIFVSWGGDRSRVIAEALCDLLKECVDGLEPWFSGETRAGQAWANTLMRELEGASAGIICLTPEAIERPWVNFESGALAKRFGTGEEAVIPFVLGMNAASVHPPIGLFQVVQADEEGTWKVLERCLEATKVKRPEDRILKHRFREAWSIFEEAVSGLSEDAPSPLEEEETPTERALEEILLLARSIDRRLASGAFPYVDLGTGSPPRPPGGPFSSFLSEDSHGMLGTFIPSGERLSNYDQLKEVSLRKLSRLAEAELLKAASAEKSEEDEGDG